MSDKLDTIFQVAPDATKTAVEQAAEIVHTETPASNTALISANGASNSSTTATDEHNRDVKSDLDYAREQIKELIDLGRTGLQAALELADQGESPRAYEVVATMLTAVVQANKELLQLHKTKKDAEKEVAGTSLPNTIAGTVNIDQAVFVGRASDLLRELQTIKKQQKQAMLLPANDEPTHPLDAQLVQPAPVVVMDDDDNDE